MILHGRAGDAQVAGQRDRKPGAGRRAVELRHHGLRHLVQDARDFHAAAQIGHLGLERQRRPALRHRLDVAADAERAAGALQQHRAHLVILGRAPRRLDQPARHVRIERIAPVGPVHGDGEQAVVELLQDDFVCAHGWCFPCCCCLLLVIPGWCAKRRRPRSSQIAASELRSPGSHASHRPGMTASRHFFTSGQRDSFQRLERLVAGNGREQLVVVPAAFGFRRLLDLEQIHVVHHAAVLADLAVLGEHVVDRRVLHDLHDGRRVGGAGGLHGLQIMRDRGIDAGLRRGRHPLDALHEALGERAGLVVEVPVEGFRQQQALRGLKPDAVDVGDEGEQRRQLSGRPSSGRIRPPA